MAMAVGGSSRALAVACAFASIAVFGVGCRGEEPPGCAGGDEQCSRTGVPAVLYADASLPLGQTLYWLGEDGISTGAGPSAELPTAVQYRRDGRSIWIGVGTRDRPFTDPASDEGPAGMTVVRRLEMPDGEIVEILVNESARPLSESELSSLAAEIVPVDGTQEDIDYYTKPS
jgi:hypothetical protein